MSLKLSPTSAHAGSGVAGGRPAAARALWKPRRSWGLLDSYLLRHVVVATLTGLSWFLGLLMVAVVITGVQKVVSNALSFGAMAQFVAFQVPRMVLFALPMAVLFGAVQTFSELSKGGEVMAMGAAGVSLIRLLRAPLLWAAFLSGFALWLQEGVVPPLERSKDALLVRQMKASLGARRSFRFEDPPSDQGPLKRLVQASGFDPSTNTLLRPRVQLYNADQQMYLQITAQSARWNGRNWIFINGQTLRLAQAGQEKISPFSSSTFGQAQVDVPAPEFLRGAETSLGKRLRQGDFLMLSLFEVADYRRQLLALPPQDRAGEGFASTDKLIQTATFGLHDKIAAPLVCIAFALVGVPLGLRSPRSGSGGAMGLSLVVLLLYYVGYTWASTLGRAGAANPLLMAYLAPGLVALTGVLLVWRRGR